jgi:hypothetical protein
LVLRFQRASIFTVYHCQLRLLAEKWADNEQGVFICDGQVCLLPTAAETRELSSGELREQIERFTKAIEQNRSL